MVSAPICKTFQRSETNMDMNLNDMKEIAASITDKIEESTEKLQEILERVECIDNSLDDLRDKADEQLEQLKIIVQQGRP